MAYALELTFDSATDTAIRAIWQALTAQQIATPDQRGPAKPHITLAVYDQIVAARSDALLAAFARVTPPLPVTFASLGLFPPSASEAVVFAAPTVTTTLLAVHERACQTLATAASQPWPYYVSGGWVPHCTLTQSCPADRLAAVIAICQTLPLPLAGQLTGIGIVETSTAEPLGHFPLHTQAVRQ